MVQEMFQEEHGLGTQHDRPVLKFREWVTQSVWIRPGLPLYQIQVDRISQIYVHRKSQNYFWWYVKVYQFSNFYKTVIKICINGTTGCALTNLETLQGRPLPCCLIGGHPFATWASVLWLFIILYNTTPHQNLQLFLAPSHLLWQNL